ncbi:MAG TPA: hypothetical protein VKT81_11380 [Bryobacteraceae bacterium]|nr:hypothetical protein [Bryobacteraceae bacterium]
MTASKILDLESVQLEKLQELILHTGPCVTLLLPPYRPGERGKPGAALLKSDIQEVKQRLVERKIPDSVITNLLEPLQQLVEDPEMSGGSHWGRVVYRSPDVLRQFAITGSEEPCVKVGGYFHIRPILTELHLPPVFFLLRLSKRDVEVFRCAGLRAAPVQLPRGIPATLEEALAFKQPDHDLENRSSAGPSSGSMHGVRFGTGSGKETQHAYLADFYKSVGRGLHELLGASGAPVVLAGVDEDTALYRAINRAPSLLAATISGSTTGPVEKTILAQAYSIVRSDCIDRAIRILRESKERLAPTRYASDPHKILRAAVEGRIAHLYIDEAARLSGIFEGTKRAGRWNWGEEDLLNVAAVETILHSGKAFSIPAGRIPDGSAIAAELRF